MKGHKDILSPFSTLLIMAALCVASLFSLRKVRVEYLPSQTGQVLTVSFSFPDASSEMVETLATSRIEAALSGITGCIGVSSVSRKGSGTISLTFKEGMDMEKARFEMATAIRNLYPSLPEDLSYPSVSRQSFPNQSHAAVVYTITGDLSTIEIEKFARERLLPSISGLSIVDEVLLSGATPWQWVITFEAEKTRDIGIDANVIAEAIKEVTNAKVFGSIETSDGRAGIRLESLHDEDFGNIPIKEINGRLYYLRDVASWDYEEAAPTYYYRVNGLNTITLSIGLKDNSNLLTAVESIKGLMGRLQSQFPEGITCAVSYDASEYMRKELNRICLRSGLCVLILLLFVLLVSRSWRHLVIVFIALSVNVLISLSVYAVIGLDIHIYSLAGITVSLGIVIDSSIMMIDHYGRWKNRKIFPAMLACTATTLGALLTILILPAEERVNLTDFIQVISVNLGISLVISYLFIPSLLETIPLKPRMASRSLKRKKHILHLLQVYTQYIAWGLRHRWIPITLSLLVAIWPAWLFYKSFDKAEFYRQPVRPQLYIHVGMPEGCSIEQLNAVVREMEHYLSTFNGIEKYTTLISSFDNALITVYFNPENEHGSYPLFIKGQIIAMAQNYGGATWSVSGIDDSGFSISNTSIVSGNRIALTGYNYQELIRFAELIISYMKSQSRLVSNLEIWSGENIRPGTEYYLQYNFQLMEASGVNPYDYYRLLSSSLWKSYAGYSYNNGSRSRIILQSSELQDNDLWHVLHQPLQTGSGKITLSQFGTIEKRASDRVINRENQAYRVEVHFDYSGDFHQCGSLIQKTVSHFNDEVLPMGYKAESRTIGLFDYHKERFFWLVTLILLIMGGLLAITFESLRLPWYAIGLVPLSLTGIFLVFGLSNLSFDQGGFAALVMLCGLTVNAGVYLIYSFQHSGGYGALTRKKGIRLYIKSFSDKCIPIILSITSTVLGLLPFFFDGPSEPFWFNFAAGTSAGMFFSLIAMTFLLPLFAIPSLKD